MMLSALATVGWMMNTSRPRALRSIRTKISPSAKLWMVTPSQEVPSASAISRARGRLARPARRSRGPRTGESSMTGVATGYGSVTAM